MHIYNFTTKDFLPLGLSNLAEVLYPFIVALAVIFQVTLLANGAILLAIGTEKKLHPPRNYFLANLSLLDRFCPSVTVPKMIEHFLTEQQSIYFVGCALQLYFLPALPGTEVLLLAIMAYELYVVMFPPSLHPHHDQGKLCPAVGWNLEASGFLHYLLHRVFTFHLSFCKSHKVNQYYCDVHSMVALSCSSTYVAEMLVLVVGGILAISAFLITFIFYFYIISTILKIPPYEGKCKSFSTCTSHLLVVGLFYSSIILTYNCPSSSHHSPGRDSLISMLYAISTPILNAITYSLKNPEVKEALKRFYIIKHDYSKHNIDKVLI